MRSWGSTGRDSHGVFAQISWRSVAALLVALLAAACGGGGGGDGSPPAAGGEVLASRNYFPLDTGNRWFYRVEPGGAQVSARVAGTQVVNGATGVVVEFSDASSTSTSIYVQSADSVREYPGANADPFTVAIGPIDLIRFGVKAGESYVQVDKVINGFDVDGDGRPEPVTVRAVVTVIGFESLATPAGTLTGVLHQRTVITESATLTTGGSGTVTITIDDWYAPGVGQARSAASVSSGGVTDTGNEVLAGYGVAGGRSENVAPTVQSVTPQAALVRGAGLVVSATFSEPVDRQSFESGGLIVTDGAGQRVPGTVSVDGAVATFLPSQAWASGTYIAHATTQAKDLVGNALAAELTWRFDIDAVSPSVVRSTPVDGAHDVSATTSLVFEFSEPLDPAAIPPGSLLQTADLFTPVPVTVTLTGSTLTLTPKAPLERGRRYVAQIAGFQDTLGNPMVGGYQAFFDVDQGRFAYPTNPGLKAGADAVAIGDVNGDGVNDLVMTGNFATNLADNFKVFVALGRADGTLAEPVPVDGVAMPTCFQTSIAIGDLNGDGRKDIVVANQCGFTQVLLQAADGSFTAGPLLTHFAVSKIRLADVNGDGRLDLVGVAPNISGFGIWLQDANHTLVAQPLVDFGASGARELEVADLNGDGRPDLVATLMDPPLREIAVLLQNTDHTFQVPQFLATASRSGAWGLAVGDLNGDGRNDLVVADALPATPGVSLFYQGANGTLGAATTLPTYANASAARIADIDGDGRLDLVLAHDARQVAGVYLQKTDATLAAGVGFLAVAPLSPFHSQGLAVGDLSRDGRPDIVVSGIVLLQKAFAPVQASKATAPTIGARRATLPRTIAKPGGG